MYDTVGNGRSLSNQDLINLGFPTQIEVISVPEDIIPPQLLEFDFSPKSIDTSSSSQQVTFTLRLTDNLSGVVAATFPFVSPSGQQYRFAGVYEDARISGDALDGIYRCAMEFPQYSEAGTWHLSYLWMYDTVGNGRSLSNQDLINLGFPTQIENGGERQVSVLAVADEEYIDCYDDWWDPWDQDQWKSEMVKAVELGDNAFEREFQINFVVKEIGTWDSDDNTHDLYKLFDEVRREIDKGTNDVMVAFTNQDIKGNVRENLFWGPYTGGILGLAEGLGDDIIVVLAKDQIIDNVHQHEYSHLFGAPDHGNVMQINCIMSYAWSLKINDWCGDCYSTISAKKWREF
jgi:hypothetical protein